ncbi:hypothetical protein [Roseomonas sp. WA12]
MNSNSPIPDQIYSDIVSGDAVNLKQAAVILGLNYQLARKRIYRDGLPVYKIRKVCFVRVCDLFNPRLRIS